MKTNHRMIFLMLAFVALAMVAVFDVSAATMLGGVMVAPVAALADAVSVDELDAVAKKFKSSHEDLVEAGKEVKGRLDKGEQLSASLKESIDKLLTGHNTIEEKLAELEQLSTKAREQAERTEQEKKSFGTQLSESKQMESFREKGFAGSMRFEQKVVNSAAAGGLIQSYREPGVTELPRREMTVRDLLNVVPISTSSVDYVKQLSRTNNAAPVAEAAAKPYSDYAWTQASVPVRTIAHLAKLTRQALDDAPRLAAEVDSEMRYGLDLVEEAQILNGDGTGQNLHGILPQATVFASPGGATVKFANRIDVIRLAMLQAAIALYRTTGIVMNDTDWAGIELTKTEDGAYLMSNPTGVLAPRLWGKPVVATQAIAADNFLTGDFQTGATLYDRMAIEVLISTENADDFEKNLATMRAERREALAVKKPGAFIKGVFSTAITAITPA